MLARRIDFDGAISPATIRSLRERIEILEEENRQLQEAARPLVTFPREWRLTHSEGRILSALMRSETGALSKEALLTAMYGLEPDVEIRIIDVFVCKLRKKLSTLNLGIEIQTVWGRGFAIAPGGRASLKAALDAGPEAPSRLSELEVSVGLLTERAVEREAEILALQRRLEALQAESISLRTPAVAPVPAPAAPKERTWKRWAGPPKRGTRAVAGLRGGRRGR